MSEFIIVDFVFMFTYVLCFYGCFLNRNLKSFQKLFKVWVLFAWIHPTMKTLAAIWLSVIIIIVVTVCFFKCLQWCIWWNLYYRCLRPDIFVLFRFFGFALSLHWSAYQQQAVVELHVLCFVMTCCPEAVLCWGCMGTPTGLFCFWALFSWVNWIKHC